VTIKQNLAGKVFGWSAF